MPPTPSRAAPATAPTRRNAPANQGADVPENPAKIETTPRTAIDQAIKLGLFAPNPGDHCRTCTVPDFCEVFGSRAHEFPPTSPESDPGYAMQFN